jgi:SAM-dependent methyltransferase
VKDWAYYDSPHSIYVNALHRDVHYATIADEIARYVPSPSAAVLDYGCGEALHADRIAAAAGRLTLVDAAPSVRARLTERFEKNPKITVVSPEQAATMPDRSFNLVVLHSVAQYLSGEDFDRIATLFRRLLKPDGLFLLGDVVPHEVPRFPAPSRCCGSPKPTRSHGPQVVDVLPIVADLIEVRPDRWRRR